MKTFILPLVYFVFSLISDHKKMVVAGIITDSAGKPIASATVTATSSHNSAPVSSNGLYIIAVDGKKEVLVFSAASFSTASVKVDSRNMVNVVLQKSGTGETRQ